MSATVEEVAQAFDVSVRRVNQLAKDHTIPREARGQYDLVECLKAYVPFLQKAVSAKGSMDEDGEITTNQGGRSRLLHVQAERAELDLARARGELMSVADHYSVLSDMIIEVKARVMGIGPRAAPHLVAQDSRVMIQAKIEAEAKLALMDLAKSVPKLTVPAAAVAEQEVAEPKPAAKKKTSRKKARSRAR